MVTKTVIFPIDLLEEQQNILYRTLKVYTKAFNECVDEAWGMDKISKTVLHERTYYSLKSKLGLKSQYLCSARNRAAEVVLAMRKLSKKGKKVSKPCAKLIPLRLDVRTLSFDKDKSVASIATQGARIKVAVPWYGYAERYREWHCQAGEVVIDRRGRWVLRLVFTSSVTMPQRTGRVWGADRGIKHAVVLSNNSFYGESWWKEHERKILLHIARLQSKGTKSAKQRLEKVWHRLRRFRQDCDRVVAKRIMANLEPGDTVVFEDLTHIKDRCGIRGKACKKHRKAIGRWSFKRLENTLEENAELCGIYIERVKSHYTSQMCSRCGVICKSNRKSQSFYSCRCGLHLNADLNAARNIANKWCGANGGAPGSTVNRPIVAGMLSSIPSYKPPTSVGGS